MAQDSSLPDFWETRYHDNVTPWDAGRSPRDLLDFAQTLPTGARILIPGCGSGYEVMDLSRLGFDVLAIDFSQAAVDRARALLGAQSALVQFADFFAFDVGPPPLDVVYERAFLCALPRKLWQAYADRMAELLQPSKLLAGFFFYRDSPRGPPFGTSPAELHQLLDPTFELIEDRPAADSLAVFEGGERWQVWRRL